MVAQGSSRGGQTRTQRRLQGKMVSVGKERFLPQEPYYIPGYSGFYPQVRYQLGKPYGRLTCDVLTDPKIQKSPLSLLAPLTKPKFTNDFTSRDRPFRQCMDQHQNYIPGYSGSAPYPGCLRLPPAPAPCATTPKPTLCPPTGAEPGPAAAPCHPGLRLACGPGWRQFSASIGGDSNPAPKMYLCHPDVALVCGREERAPCDAGMALVCGQGCRAACEETTRIEATPLPPPTETTTDICRFDRTPKMDAPNLIQRKAISGYTGYIPRFPWIMGENYTTGVKDAMDEFDRNQEMLRSPMYSFGKRLPSTYWPNTQIYTSGGLMPFYTGFVPTIRHNYAQTFGNSTRQAFFSELQRRQREG